AGQDADIQKRILQMLASSQVLREHMSEIKRDLYLAGSQIPDYAPDAAFGAELMRLTQTWIRTVYNRKFALRNFYRSREFFGILLAVTGLVLLAIGVAGFRLMGQ
ncbi:MAG: hypothetical protein ACXVB9_07640, partial [Bdellovibrionota bacterium]